MKFKHFADFTARPSFQIFFFSCLCSPLSVSSIVGSYHICLYFLLIFEISRADCDGAVLGFFVFFLILLSIQPGESVLTLST